MRCQESKCNFHNENLIFSRIPCSKSDPSSEVNRFGCLSQPGCAYDTQLANIRAAKGHAILPGVPVCHLAIRNIQFHKLVKDYLQKVFFWKCFDICLLFQHHSI